LFRQAGPALFDSDLIVDEFRGEFARKMKEAPNFFKHAAQDGSDADRSVTFYPEANDMLPLFLIQGLRDMGEALGFEETSYINWMHIHEPDLFQSKGSFLPINVVEQLIHISKPSFFKACEMLWEQGKLRDYLGSRGST
jgi:hypothetical protein